MKSSTYDESSGMPAEAKTALCGSVSAKNGAADKVVMRFAVLWEGWEMDNEAWVMERPDCSRYLVMTNHGARYMAMPSDLRERIAEYEKVLADSRKALALL
jgi:hypothetical protein